MQDKSAKTAASATPAETYNLVTFRLDQETYALPIEAIIKIISMVTITSIPRVHKSVEGIINVRGAAVPVINLRRYLGVPEVALGLHTPIILVQVFGRTMGMIVDEVIDVKEVNVDHVARLGDIMPEKLGDIPILDGIVHTEDGAILLLNIDQLFRPNQIEALTRVMDSLPETLVEQPGAAEGSSPQEKDTMETDHSVEAPPPQEQTMTEGQGIVVESPPTG
jgi:purine-binding chemotaxis protein CheW